MNPVLIKPSGERHSQVLRHGPPLRRRRRAQLPGPQAASCARPCSTRSPTCARATTSSSARAPAARPRSTCARATWPTWASRGRPTSRCVLVGDIDRGGVFASLYGSLALLEPDDQALVAGFVINKFRGDDTILAPGLEQLLALTGRPTLGVLPWLEGCGSTPRTRWRSRPRARRPSPPRGGDTLEVAVVRLRWMSNFTDVDALTAEPGVSVRFTRSPADVRARRPRARARHQGHRRGPRAPARRRPRRRAARAAPRRRPDPRRLRRLPDARRGDRGRGREPAAGRWPASGCFRSAPASRADKLLRRVAGAVALAGGAPATGYEIRHGEPTRDGGEALIDDGSAEGEGCAVGPCSAPRGTACSRATRSAAACSRGWRSGAAGAGARERSPSRRSASATSTDWAS